MLDLDLNGIQTNSFLGDEEELVLFDHDADGVKTAFGWVDPNDGWLVLDRNGNGAIDNGNELFGQHMIMSNGEKAEDGFKALANFDQNKDGVIDINDDVFNDIQIWRDLNQDGISQSHELFGLDDYKIVQLWTQGIYEEIDHGNGNVEIAYSGYLREIELDGATYYDMGTVADVVMAEDAFYSEYDKNESQFFNRVHLDLHGSGRVPNLQNALYPMNLRLYTTLSNYQNADNRESQQELLDDLGSVPIKLLYI